MSKIQPGHVLGTLALVMAARLFLHPAYPDNAVYLDNWAVTVALLAMAGVALILMAFSDRP